MVGQGAAALRLVTNALQREYKLDYDVLVKYLQVHCTVTALCFRLPPFVRHPPVHVVRRATTTTAKKQLARVRRRVPRDPRRVPRSGKGTARRAVNDLIVTVPSLVLAGAPCRPPAVTTTQTCLAMGNSASAGSARPPRTVPVS